MAMRRLKIAELKGHLSQHLRAVTAGEEIEVMERTRPVARIVPIRCVAEALELLPAALSFSTVRRRRLRPARLRVSSRELLREERGRR
jgi:prevent-host-death family protein